MPVAANSAREPPAVPPLPLLLLSVASAAGRRRALRVGHDAPSFAVAMAARRSAGVSDTLRPGAPPAMRTALRAAAVAATTSQRKASSDGASEDADGGMALIG